MSYHKISNDTNTNDSDNDSDNVSASCRYRLNDDNLIAIVTSIVGGKE